MNYTSNNHPEAYEFLSKTFTPWIRKDKWHITVYTDGYISADCLTVEAALRSNGFVSISRKYDSKIGKTITIYKHN